MPGTPLQFILGSASPRRYELLASLVGTDRLRVVKPQSTEPGFAGLHEWKAIENRLRETARGKREDVVAQLRSDTTVADNWIVLAADTVIVVTDDAGRQHVLGKPPTGPEGGAVVRRWFEEFYFGKTHVAATAVGIETSDGQVAGRIVTTRVTFDNERRRWLDWYLTTGEPFGKAGGYALQGAGSLFVSQVIGSSSNVVGLPLGDVLELFEEVGVPLP